MRRVLWLLSLVLLGVLSARPCQAAVERFAVLVGNNRGAQGEADLRYAEADAERMHAVLKGVGGFRPENMLLLRHESAASVQRALIAVNDRVRAAQSRPGTQVMLFVYYSGHADARALHLGSTRLELTVLEQLVRSSAAAFRVLVVDACRSGALTRVKGGRKAPAFSVRVDEALDGEGVVFLTSSSANEDAQESDELKGSFFTHYFRSGLLGPADTDGDGRITLDEVYRYAHAHTLRASSRTLGGTQHPTFRYELKGQGRVVLSRPVAYSKTRGTLRFPNGRDYLIFHRNEQGALTGEVAAYDSVRAVSVAPGRYFVRARTNTHLLEGHVDVSPGQTLEVADTKLERFEYARLARKGGGGVSFSHGPLGGYTFRTSLQNESGLCHGGLAGYALVFPALTLTPWFGMCGGDFENEHLAASSKNYDLGLRVAHAWDFPVVTLELGLDAGTSVYHQRFETNGLAPARISVGARFGIFAGLTLDLGAGFALFSQSAAETHLFSLEHSETRKARTAASVAYRHSLGLLKFF